MISRIPRKYRHKYKKKHSWDEELTFFVFKLVTTTVLFFVVAVGADVYHLFH